MADKNFKVKNGLDIGDDITIADDGSIIGLDTDDLNEGTTNIYYTEARVDANFATKTTDALTEGTTNKYYSSSLFDADLATKDTGDLAEGTNLYYTEARVDANFATKTTDDLDEGTTNQYFTNARARQAISASDTGGDGSLSYDNSTGVITYTGPSATEVRAHFSGGTGISIADGVVAVDFTEFDTDEVVEGTTNLYYTDGRFDTRFATKTTDNLSEGLTNLFYTNARADARIAAASIDALSDVVITTGTAGQMLYYNGTNWVNSSTVDSANLSRFTRTNTGTSNNAVLTVNRNRTDAARATDGGPWLGFEYTGTDNTQATSSQNAIRSMYDAAGNHKLQMLQLPGSYATPSIVAQIQRGNHYFVSTTGYNILNLTDTASTTRANTHALANSANTTTYATIGATGITMGNVDGVVNFVRASGANVGTRPVAFLKNIVTATTTPATNDGASFRFQAQGSNGTAYHVAQFSGIYSSTGDTAFGVDIANGDQNGATMTVVRPMTVKLSETRISATASPTATPGGNTLTDVAIFAPANTTIKSNAVTLQDNSGSALKGGDIAYRRTFGCFHKLANVTAAAADTVYAFDWTADTTAHVNTQGVTVSNTSRINFDNAGDYNIVIEMVGKNTDSQDRTAYVWLAKNGTDLSETAIKLVLSKETTTMLAKDWLVNGIADNDYIEVRFAVDTTTSGISLEYSAAQTSPYVRPAVASATITITPVGA